MSENQPILEIRNLRKHFYQKRGFLDSILNRGEQIQAVDGVSLSLKQSESQGLIGESGCGKSTLLLTMLGLEEPTGGMIFYKGEDVSTFDRKRWKTFRRNVQTVFQDPFNSLDPKQTVEETLEEPLKIHNISNRDTKVRETLNRVELRPPEKYLGRLPQTLSGGEKQRVSIARALVLDPEVLLADEPVSMLDVSTQAAVLKLLTRLQRKLDLSIFYVSHDLSTVGYVCDVMNVMYLGRIIERAETDLLLENPKHPYSKALIDAIPVSDPDHDRPRTILDGSPQTPINLGEGCRFRDRCPERMDVCENTPRLIDTKDGNQVACHLYYEHESERKGTAAADVTPQSATGVETE